MFPGNLWPKSQDSDEPAWAKCLPWGHLTCPLFCAVRGGSLKLGVLDRQIHSLCPRVCSTSLSPLTWEALISRMLVLPEAGSCWHQFGHYLLCAGAGVGVYILWDSDVPSPTLGGTGRPLLRGSAGRAGNAMVVAQPARPALGQPSSWWRWRWEGCFSAFTLWRTVGQTSITIWPGQLSHASRPLTGPRDGFSRGISVHILCPHRRKEKAREPVRAPTERILFIALDLEAKVLLSPL